MDINGALPVVVVVDRPRTPTSLRPKKKQLIRHQSITDRKYVESNLDLKNQNIYDYLEPTDQVLLAQEITNSYNRKLHTDGVGSYAHLRYAYQNQKLTQHGALPEHTNQFIRRTFVMKRAFLSLFNHGRTLLIISLLNMIPKLVFCIMYLQEISYNTIKSNREELQDLEPRLLYVARTQLSYYVLVILSIISLVFATFNALASLFKISLKVHAIQRADNILENGLCIWLVVNSMLQNGKNLYVPYFLFMLSVPSLFNEIMHYRRTWGLINVSDVSEKVLKLFLATLVIVYVGICCFNFFENNLAYFAKLLLNPSSESKDSLSVMDTFYFVIVTISTVGYGDVIAKTAAGQLCVIGIICVAIVQIPVLASELQNTFQSQANMGVESYRSGNSKFVLFCGDFTSIDKFKRAVKEIWTNSLTEKSNVLILGRKPLMPYIKSLIYNRTKYRGRVTYMRERGLDYSNLVNLSLKQVSAIFIMADYASSDPIEEDQNNMLRAWAFHDFAPGTNIFVETIEHGIAESLPNTKCTHN
jgi:hypothetical protein